jgi:hypothetical protein
MDQTRRGREKLPNRPGGDGAKVIARRDCGSADNQLTGWVQAAGNASAERTGRGVFSFAGLCVIVGFALA